MTGGLIVCILYITLNYVNPYFTVLGLSHLSAGIFGMIVNFGLQVGVSLATAPPPREVQEMVDDLRIPVGEMYEGNDAEPTPAFAPASGAASTSQP
jgi:cation/acetate symporter